MSLFPKSMSLIKFSSLVDVAITALQRATFSQMSKSVYRLQMIAAKTIPVNDELYSYLENPEINKKNFYSSAKKGSKVETDEKFEQNDNYVILSVTSKDVNKNDVVICKVKTVNAPSKEKGSDNFVIMVAILIGFALFFSLSMGSSRRY